MAVRVSVSQTGRFDGPEDGLLWYVHAPSTTPTPSARVSHPVGLPLLKVLTAALPVSAPMCQGPVCG